MTENTDSTDSDCTDSDDWSDIEADLDALKPSNVFDDFEPLVTVPRPPCDACDTNHHDGLQDTVLGDATYEVCARCLDVLQHKIENFYWYDRLTEAHYDRAAEYLRSLDEVWCVKDHGYPGGEMWVHTPFCHASVVGDVCDHFGFTIYSFAVVHPGDHEFDCLHDHGPCIEINLDYPSHASDPMPLECDIFEQTEKHYSETEWLEDEHRLFERADRD